MTAETDRPSMPFLFVCCQAGAEATVKSDLICESPDWRLAFSRPGFVTFKLPSPEIDNSPQLKSAFARTYGWSVGRTEVGNVSAASDLLLGKRIHHIHVWPRDICLPGDRGFQPGPTKECNEIGARLLAATRSRGIANAKVAVNRQAKIGQTVLDCVVVDENQWWIGYHTVSCFGQQWPGGVPDIKIPETIVSRAYLKMDEALQWSRLPVQKGDAVVEIGSAPGGACQRLLEGGLKVTGVDPSEMDASILKHPNFTHLRKRGSDVRRRDYRDFKWLMADSNVAPNHTLDTVEAIVTHDQTNLRGVLLTLKLLEWKLVGDVPEFLRRIRSWGYEYVRCRQLAFQRQEICVAALKTRSMRRPRRASVVRQKRKTKSAALQSSNDEADASS